MELEIIYQKLSIERSELSLKLLKLRDFIVSEKFSELDEESKELMLNQSVAMTEYLSILDKRALLVFDKIDYS